MNKEELEYIKELKLNDDSPYQYKNEKGDVIRLLVIYRSERL